MSVWECCRCGGRFRSERGAQACADRHDRDAAAARADLEELERELRE